MSYRGAWDGGPPGAESEYAPRPPQPYAPAPPAPPMPTTDPWTGVSYSQYGPPPYDYQNYSASTYNYNYDANYYRQQPDNYYQKYPQARGACPSGDTFDVAPKHRTRSRSDERAIERRRRSYSRSVSPRVKIEGEYSRKRDSYDEGRKGRSRSRSNRPKRGKYSSSDRSSSRSSSHSLRRKVKDRRRSSSASSGSNHSYKKLIARKVKSRQRSYTPPIKKSLSHSRNRSRSQRSLTKEHSSSKSPRLRRDKDVTKGKGKALPTRDKGKEKKSRAVMTPPRKIKEEPLTPPRGLKGPSITPPKSYIKKERSTTPVKKRTRLANTPPRKNRDSSLTPPKSYARSRSSSSSRSGSRSPTPKPKSKARKRRSRSSSKSSRSRSRSKRRRAKSASKHRSRTKSRSPRSSKSRSRSRSRSKSRSRKRTRSPRSSKSRSRSGSSHSGRSSHSGTPGEERRGQFTVADRKRFWKLHRSRQEEKRKERPESPPKEVKPPPGAVEPAQVDDIEYGDPPEVEGPNFAELLPSAVPPHLAQASSSKPKGPITIKNDGSFLEMFKKMQEATKKVEEEKKPEIKKPVLPFIGKRRGGRVLKTGLVKKAKAIEEQLADNAPKDAWSLYMQEVKKYRETSCEEERKTRPLVNIMPEMIKSPEQIKTAPFDPRFPNTNQTKYCYQSYLDFYRCQKVRGEKYEPCQYFKRVFTSLCPIDWVEKWDSQRAEGSFPGRI